MSNGNGYHRVFHLPHWDYPAKLPGLTGLYLNTVFRTLALGLVGIFIPVFLYQFPGRWDEVISFYFILNLASIVFTLPAAYLIKKWGPDFLMGIAAFSLFCSLILLTKAQNNPIFISWSALLWGITASFHWLPYHQAFSWESTRERLSEQVAHRIVFNKLAAVAAPVVGGIIAVKLGFSGLYFIAAIILTISIVPIFMDQYNRRGDSLGLESLKKTFLKITNLPYWLGFLGTGLEAATYGIFLPVFLYQRLGNLEQIGLLTTISLFMALITIRVIGKKAKKKEKTIFYLGLMISFPFWLIIGFLESIALLMIANSWYQITTHAFWIPQLGVIYRQGRKQGKHFFVLRNLFIRFGILLALGLVILINRFSLGWIPIFFIGAGGLLLVTFFDQELKNKK